MDQDNLKTRQFEELNGLECIFPEFRRAESLDSSHEIEVCSKDNEVPFKLSFVFPQGYPIRDPPVFTLGHPLLRQNAISTVSKRLLEIYMEHPDEGIVFQWIEWLRENLCSYFETENHEVHVDHGALNQSVVVQPEVGEKDEDKNKNDGDRCCDITWQHGEPIRDRKSVFVGHLALVHSVSEAEYALDVLKDKFGKNVSAIRQNLHNWISERSIPRLEKGEEDDFMELRERLTTKRNNAQEAISAAKKEKAEHREKRIAPVKLPISKKKRGLKSSLDRLETIAREEKDSRNQTSVTLQRIANGQERMIDLFEGVLSARNVCGVRHRYDDMDFGDSPI